jgi:hypothetical protein
MSERSPQLDLSGLDAPMRGLAISGQASRMSPKLSLLDSKLAIDPRASMPIFEKFNNVMGTRRLKDINAMR